ncbi:30S ribosomal protein S4 [Patescibacteria group bacterium]|nr:30S ribosomal protein S4 [Patescibacteria group bacterium]MBU1705394.1 30S ribosomal protein S4 [Patescibacteria group bacterium]
MSIPVKSTCKHCRREGVSLCGRENCAFKKRGYPPGVHGPKNIKRKPRLSSYGLQLREKQKAKRLYNIQEKQFRRYFEMANRSQANTAERLVQLLETRLDNTVHRLGIAKTRRQARQMVSHGFIQINGKTVDIPSYQVSIGEVITIKPNKQGSVLIKNLTERLAKVETPKWLHLDASTITGKVTGKPEGEDLRQVFDPTLTVEFYSR